ncbi:cation diffusion facilitator family transporter [Desulfomicrobium baculatum]|uniref:Cation diffusion facilitator family transporter n=1 Tax=Desulfomicrobium baculatum (strain DSM 4028 / VKM B-1378 / X) TaxID=525897 RepID=C7LNE2_DESBD|nr:cation diffusion facilitator family transporter [Desulfomicrobium baculatum]ACU90111.1 cation diffusion facilitator family transporter [Desulfomicrobium baculatum DSM 4028]
MLVHARKYAYLSIGASLLTMALKFGAFFLTGSVGLFSDAVESVVNLTAGLIALMAIILAYRPADQSHAYGHGKVEYFSSGMEGILICIAALGIAYASAQRFLHPQELHFLGTGIVVATLAGAVNFAVSRIMLRAAREYDSIVLEADAKHLLTDVWTSAGLVSALAVMHFAPPSWQILDPILGLIMSVNIIWTGVGLVRRSAAGLMDEGLPTDEIFLITDVIKRIGGTEAGFHALRTRKSGSVRFVDFHLLVPGSMTVQESHDLCCDIEESIKAGLPGSQTTIHVEPREDHASFDGWKVGGLCDRSACQKGRQS